MDGNRGERGPGGGITTLGEGGKEGRKYAGGKGDIKKSIHFKPISKFPIGPTQRPGVKTGTTLK